MHKLGGNCSVGGSSNSASFVSVSDMSNNNGSGNSQNNNQNSPQNVKANTTNFISNLFVSKGYYDNNYQNSNGENSIGGASFIKSLDYNELIDKQEKLSKYSEDDQELASNKDVVDHSLSKKSSQLKDTNSLLSYLTNYKSPYNIKFDKFRTVFDDLYENSDNFLLYEHSLFWFPEYLSLQKNTMKTLMEEEKFIPLTWKYYLGIMSASALRCEYLFNVLCGEFLACGGELNWLIYGIKKVPEKLQLLGKLNNILANQPWKLSLFDFNLVLGKNTKFDTQWNLNELTHAFLIIISFQKLATYINTLGIKVKLDDPVDIYEILRGILCIIYIRTRDG